MKKQINNGGLFPMPVLMIATYNEDGTVDVMNAAWAANNSMTSVALNLSKSHKTVKNMIARGGFTIAFADAAHVAEADYFGIESANNVADKFAKTGLTFTKAEHVDAPVVNEFPVALECTYNEKATAESGNFIIGDIVNTIADESVLTDGKLDIAKANLICFDQYTKSYLKIGEKVGNAYSDGKKFKD